MVKSFLTPATARFVLALLALGIASAAIILLMKSGIQPEAKDAVIFALGLVFARVEQAFGYYFGSTARGDHGPVDTRIVNAPADPVPVTQENP